MIPFFRLQSLATFKALLYRDVRSILWTTPGRLIDAAIVSSLQILAISQFFPLLGMPNNMIAPLFLSTITQITFSISYGIAFNYVADLHNNRFINYQIILPMPKLFLFAEYILVFMIEISLVSLPLIISASLFLGPLFPVADANWPAAVLIYLLATFFYAALFLYLAFNCPYTWFLDNVWPRRLAILFLFGCSFFTWKKLYNFSPYLATLFLLNPVTFIHEGFRAALLGGNDYLPLWICIPVVFLFCLLIIFLLTRAIKKRLDPV